MLNTEKKLRILAILKALLLNGKIGASEAMANMYVN